MPRVLRLVPALLLLLACPAGAARGEDVPEAPPGWPAGPWRSQAALERDLLAAPSAERLARWHEMFCAEPHLAGSPGSRRLADAMQAALGEMGLEVQREPFDVWLPVHEDASVEVLVDGRREALPLREDRLAADPAVREEVPPAFNAYSGSGEAEGEVVYANYGTREDFALLAERGVSCQDRVVVARYGRNYRGFKARYAQAAGAAALLIYTDPADGGYAKGLPYPEGGYADASSIQRGSILTLPWPGDPLTPFQPAATGTPRLDPDAVDLPRLPVQPLGWGAARRILEPMRGSEVPDGWQGGLPFRYRLTGGGNLRVRVRVRQPRASVRVENVVAVLRGAASADEWVVVGCHYDAWTFGAGDPHAGSIVLFEMARSFAEAARRGLRPARTLVFANWTAEEMGLIGSTEWCEAHRDALGGHGVAYVNLDMAAMGPDFHAEASPALRRGLEDATRGVPQARAPETTVHAAWRAAHDGRVEIGDMGGGSDHVGFLCHLGVPSLGLGAGGSRGVSYHSAYDTLAWYRKVVGDYEPARMLARVGNVLVARLANAPLVGYDLARGLVEGRAQLERIFGVEALAREPLKGLAEAFGVRAVEATRLQADLDRAAASGALAGEDLARANALLLSTERAWLHPDGLPGRPWFRSLQAASDPTSGYAAWALPWLREVHEHGDADLGVAVLAHQDLLVRLAQHHRALRALLGG